MFKEKERLINMLDKNKISKEDYKLLSKALNSKGVYLCRFFAMLLNPFQKIAGLNALLMGFSIIILMSFIGVTAKLYFPGVISCLNSVVIKNPQHQLNFIFLLYENVLCWFILSVLFITSAKILQKKDTRMIDFFGTVALSRYPFLVLTVFIAFIQIINSELMNIDLSKGLQVHMSPMMIALTFVTIICVIWQVITYLSALKVSSGLQGTKLWISFIISITLGEMISSFLTMMFI